MTIPMTLFRLFKWIAGIGLALIALAAVVVALVGWNWLREPIERMTLEKTGRALAIGGDITIEFAWPQPRFRAGAVSFANPPWAGEKQMVAAEAVEIVLDLPQLLRRNLVFPELRLRRPVIFLEQGAGGRKNWLLDLEQQDEGARIQIGRLMLDQGSLGYDDAGQKTSIRAEVSTADGGPPGSGLSFSAQGRYKGQPLKVQGTGGPVLALRDESTPYPLQAELSIGLTVVKAEGSVTSLLKLSALDLRVALRGSSLAQLYPLLGIVFPETGPYATEGHLVHSGRTWRYDKFSGRIGKSDIAGSVEVVTGGKRPTLKADLNSRLLDLADLGPLIGARPGRLQVAQDAPLPSDADAPTPTRARVLPDLPFKTDRWSTVDADVSLKAAAIRADKLPLENLDTHLSLKDSVLTLDPLDFGVAGGQLKSVITLDGSKQPIEAHAKLRARKIQIAQLFPGADLSDTSIGQLNGEFDLTGKGNSVGRMLATSNGKLGLIVARGQISRLMMEKAGLHIWEILQLNVTGDKLVKLRCAVGDFDVKDGTLQTQALVFDTEITTILGTGSIDLAEEKLDLTLNQKTKDTSPLALRSPIHVRGTLAQPDISVDRRIVAARALGAIALGAVNPLLALIPLIDLGPGGDSDCRQLISDARALPHTGKRARAAGSDNR
ncbi:AsmA family protein [Dechloromonas sp. A34]|uniref:AsmA family protein n=1 Tax=Dechloromonas sp. A34 TaxID=447588 RepID=UPI00224997B9|nr:AsmA family protein [Dechloromonas sp. A34]